MENVILFGGIAETGEIVRGLLDGNAEVLLVTATDEPLAIPDDPRLRRRPGRLDVEGMIALIRAEEIAVIVVAAHPYAVELERNAIRAAAACDLPIHLYRRPNLDPPLPPDAQRAATHDEAASLAVRSGRPILLTIGSQHVATYAREAVRRGVELHARVLDRPESIRACRDAGIPTGRIIAHRGAVAEEENRRQIRDRAIGVLVMKESGGQGGEREKIRAAVAEKCRLIVVTRPAPVSLPEGAKTYDSPSALIAAIN
jgi:precorrin-6A/cobalt-precorrin-6A reductase